MREEKLVNDVGNLQIEIDIIAKLGVVGF